VRLLHLTDTHLGVDRWFRGAPPGWRRCDDHLAAFRRALGPALRRQVDVVVHTGDLFDRSQPPARAVAEAAAVLEEVARLVPVLLMPGNHDRRGLRGHLPHIPGVEVVDRPATVALGGVRLAVVPWMAEAAAWADAARAVWREGADLLLAHQAFDGTRVPHHVFRAGIEPDTVGAEHLPPGVTHILCGHIHPRQAVRVGGAMVVIPGSTERTAFNERFERKGTAVWELGSTPTWRFVDLPSRPMHLVRTIAECDRVEPGSLVRLDRTASDPAALEQEILARGGWVEPWAAPETRQVPLFG
jgi:DNA repair exonuclease SbcCD nuclease subunit